MPIIDCDAHVEESDATWGYMPEEWRMFRPFAVTFPQGTYFGSHDPAWVIDYKIRLFAANPTIMTRATQKGTSIPIQEMADVPGRLAAMDAMGIDLQVVFPSLWLGNARRERSAGGGARVELQRVRRGSVQRIGRPPALRRRAALAPSGPAVAEIQRVKTLGSLVGIFVRGMEWDSPLTHPNFRPLFADAEAQNLPIAVHVGNGTSPTIGRMLEGIPRPHYGDPAPPINPLGNGIVSAPYVQYAFQQILGSDMLERFPTLRVGFMEAGAEWTVPLIRKLRERKGAGIDTLLGERVFVACANDEDLPHIIDRVGVDFLVTQTDFPHGDAFRQDRLAESLAERGDVSGADIGKILSDNRRGFTTSRTAARPRGAAEDADDEGQRAAGENGGGSAHGSIDQTLLGARAALGGSRRTG